MSIPLPLDGPFKGSPNAEVRRVIITPEYAEYLLTRNVSHNRNKIAIRVDEYAAQMIKGTFPYTGASICVDWDGLLLDGQNRLYACIKSGISFETNLVTNLDPEVFRYMDQGKNRTATDFYTIAARREGHEPQYKTQAAALSGILIEDQLFKNGFCARMAQGSGLSSTPAERGDFAHSMLDNASFQWALESGTHLRAVMTSRIGSYCAYKSYQVDPKAAEAFIVNLRDGTNMDRTNPIFTLRELLLKKRGRTKEKGGLTDQEVIGLTAKAFRYSRTGKTAVTLNWTFSEGYEW